VSLKPTNESPFGANKLLTTYHSQKILPGNRLLLNVTEAFLDSQGDEAWFLGRPRHSVGLSGRSLSVGKDRRMVAIHGGVNQFLNTFVKDALSNIIRSVDLIQRIHMGSALYEIRIRTLLDGGGPHAFPGVNAAVVICGIVRVGSLEQEIAKTGSSTARSAGYRPRSGNLTLAVTSTNR
jgi:hypothetical protein